MSCTSYKNIGKNEQDDYILLNIMVKNASFENSFLEKSNDNKNVINAIECKYLKSGCNYFNLDIDNDGELENMLNKKEYHFLIAQQSNSEWDYDKINYSKKSGHKRIFFSKPIYTSNGNFAFMEFDFGTRAGLQIFKQDKGRWKEYKIISPILKQPKVELKQ